MDVRTYLRAIRKSWWILLLTVVIGGAGGLAYSVHAPKIYAARLTFDVQIAATAATNVQSNDLYAQSQAVTLAKLTSSDIAARNVVTYLGGGIDRGLVSADITASADLNTTLIHVVVQDVDKARARRIAQALAATYPATARSLRAAGSSIGQVQLYVTSFPTVGNAPVLPRTKLNVALGLVLGLVLGLLVAVLRFLRDTSVRTRAELEAIAGAPLIGDIGYDAGARSAPLVLDAQSHSVRGEAFRQLRTNLQFVDAAGALQVIVVTSSTEAEGKSTTAANLALTFAEAGRTVLLVGADLRRPRLAEYLGVESALGLTNVLANLVTLDEALQPWGQGLTVLAGGAVPPNPSELLGSPHMVAVLAELRTRFDLVVIDTPPLLPVTDAAVLAVHADGVVVVARHGRTRRAQLHWAVRSLQSVNARIVGVVLTMRPARDPDSERYGSYEYYDAAPQRGLRARLARLMHPHRQVRRSRRPSLPVAPSLAATAQRDRPAGAAARARSAGSFDDRIGAPQDAGAIAGSALTAHARRQSRPARRGGSRKALAHLPDAGARPVRGEADYPQASGHVDTPAPDAGTSADAVPVDAVPVDAVPADTVMPNIAAVPDDAVPDDAVPDGAAPVRDAAQLGDAGSPFGPARTRPRQPAGRH